MKDTFLKYPSHKNSDVISFFKKSDDEMNEEYVATEKLHGTNLGVYIYRDGTYQIATRNNLMDSTETKKLLSNFYNFVPINYLKEVGERILSDNPDFKFVVFFGEYFGNGIFKMTYQQVKDKIKQFRVFNIVGHLYSEKIEDEIVQYNKKLSYDDVTNYLETPYLVPFEFRGSLKDILTLSDTSKDSQFGGIREGYVLQPTKEIVFQSNKGNALKSIKIKGELFKEVVEKRKPQENKTNKDVSFQSFRGLDEKDSEIMSEMLGYITKSRLENILSHGTIMEVSKKTTFPLVNLMIQDILDEFEYTELQTPEKVTLLSKRLTPSILNVINQYINESYTR